MSRIGIFGGSFDPVHIGHVLAAQEFVRLLDLDRLLIMPAGNPPHKQLSPWSPTAEDRLAMLHLAMDGLDRGEISEREIFQAEKCYTYDTLSALRREHPKDEVLLLMGTDMFLSFETWYRFADIQKLATICVMDRVHKSVHIQEAMEKQMQCLRDLGCTEIRFLPNHFLEVSSTEVRRMLFFGCAEDFVPASVLHYIKEHQLYRTEPLKTPLDFAELKELSLCMHDAKRRPHVVGCSDTARELAVLYGADPEEAARAGILHDITKALSADDQLRLCSHYCINTDAYTGEQVKLLHGKTASAIAEHIFHESTAVCEAISWHTTGKADMSLLEKIIYIADYVEPNRCFDGVEELRKLAYTDLDLAVLTGIQMTIELLIQDGRILNQYSVEARDYLEQRRA